MRDSVSRGHSRLAIRPFVHDETQQRPTDLLASPARGHRGSLDAPTGRNIIPSSGRELEGERGEVMPEAEASGVKGDRRPERANMK